MELGNNKKDVIKVIVNTVIINIGKDVSTLEVFFYLDDVDPTLSKSNL